MSRDRTASAELLPPFSPRLLALFAVYLRRYFRRGFDAVRLSRSGPVPANDGTPLVVYSNHASWWDPIFFMLLSHSLWPGREGYGPMDAAALEKYRFLRRLGIFGVEQGTRRGATTFLRTAEAALARPGAALWMTAEGAFRDPRERPVRLQPGLAHLVRRREKVRVVPLALEYPFWNERLPQALARFGEPIVACRGDGLDAAAWRRRLEEALERNMDALAAEAKTRDPRAFRTLVSGSRGVGGVYDLWRRLRAWASGHPFQAAHGEERS